MLNQEDFRTLAGRNVVGPAGKKIGKIDQLYADREDGSPTFVTVSTGLFGSKANFVPIAEGRVEGSDLVVPYDQDLVRNAPSIDPDGEISPAEEDHLYAHYSLTSGTTGGTPDTAYTGRGNETATADRGAVAQDTGGGGTGEAMTRSEQRLSVGKEQVERGRARLRKYVVTENVQQTVPVRREEARVEREPITEANIGDATSGPELSEQEHEITLSEERPVVAKETVPVERVRLSKEAVTDEVQVSEEVAKEQIETEDDNQGGPPAADNTARRRPRSLPWSRGRRREDGQATRRTARPAIMLQPEAAPDHGAIVGSAALPFMPPAGPLDRLRRAPTRASGPEMVRASTTRQDDRRLVPSGVADTGGPR